MSIGAPAAIDSAAPPPSRGLTSVNLMPSPSSIPCMHAGPTSGSASAMRRRHLGQPPIHDCLALDRYSGVGRQALADRAVEEVPCEVRHRIDGVLDAIHEFLDQRVGHPSKEFLEFPRPIRPEDAAASPTTPRLHDQRVAEGLAVGNVLGQAGRRRRDPPCSKEAEGPILVACTPRVPRTSRRPPEFRRRGNDPALPTAIPVPRRGREGAAEPTPAGRSRSSPPGSPQIELAAPHSGGLRTQSRTRSGSESTATTRTSGISLRALITNGATGEPAAVRNTVNAITCPGVQLRRMSRWFAPVDATLGGPGPSETSSLARPPEWRAAETTSSSAICRRSSER